MKKALSLCFVCLFFLYACENPLDLNQPELAGVQSKASFYSGLYADGTDFSLAYSSGIIRSDRIHLLWTSCKDPTFLLYRLYRDGQLIFSTVNADSCEYWDTGLQPNRFYNYKLISLIRSGMAEASQIELKTPRFFAPSEINYTYLDNNTLKLTWINNAVSATHFTVEKQISGGEPEVFECAQPHFVDHDVQLGSLYHYRVKARNDYEETNASPWANITFQYIMNPPYLSSLTQLLPSYNVKLSWEDNSSCETAFCIYCSADAGLSYQNIGSTPENTEEYIDTRNKIVGHTYLYSVQASNSQQTADSNLLSITISEELFSFYDFDLWDGGFYGMGWYCGQAFWTNAYSGTKLWGLTLWENNYPDYANCSLIMPSVNLPANSRLQFYHRYQIEDYYDGGNVQISTDNGLTWTVIHPESAYPYSNVSSLGQAGFSGSYWAWHQESFDLSAYASQVVTLRWVFGSDSSGNGYGWFIDDVKLGFFGSMQSVSLEETWQK